MKRPANRSVHLSAASDSVDHGCIRSAFSLAELLIALAVLLAVAGMAAPPLVERLRDNFVARGTESVREILSEARTLAIDSGIDYQFRYEPEGHRFVVLPSEIEPTDSNSLTSSSKAAEYIRLSGELDEQLFLKAMDPKAETTENLKTEWFHGLDDASSLSQVSWSSPIDFRFDGSATDRTFRVADAEGRTAELTVRGLTGSVRITPVYQQEEVR
jgi:Tfp pilus assembly protein FimT